MPRLTATLRETIPSRYIGGESADAIGRSLGVAPGSVRKFLRRRGVSIRNQTEAQTKCDLRHDAFEILTPEALYWCGFFAADGAIVLKDGRSPEIAVVLAAKDEQHVRKFRDFLCSTHAIINIAPNKLGGCAVRFAPRSRQIAESLCRLGVKRGPIDDVLAGSRDFWRGVIDGDGYIGISGGHAQFKLVGQEWLLDDFRRYIARLGTRTHVRPHKSIFVVATTHGGAERICDHFYTDATVALDRKLNAAKTIRSLARGKTLTRPEYFRPAA